MYVMYVDLDGIITQLQNCSTSGMIRYEIGFVAQTSLALPHSILEQLQNI